MIEILLLVGAGVVLAPPLGWMLGAWSAELQPGLIEKFETGREPGATVMRRLTSSATKEDHAMKMLLMFATAVGILAAAPYASAQTGSRSFYDGRGSFAGSSVTRGNSTSVYDRSGRFDGSIIRNSNGTTSYYDGRGRFTGSSTRR
jgi:hypothetical protein